MTAIKPETSSKEFKQGFRAALKMTLRWCECDLNFTIEELKLSLKGALMIDDLMDESENK
jgi:hypothetical protein